MKNLPIYVLSMCILVLTATMIYYPQGGRYQFHHLDKLYFAKYDKFTGEAFFCGSGLLICQNITNLEAHIQSLENISEIRGLSGVVAAGQELRRRGQLETLDNETLKKFEEKEKRLRNLQEQ